MCARFVYWSAHPDGSNNAEDIGKIYKLEVILENDKEMVTRRGDGKLFTFGTWPRKFFGTAHGPMSSKEAMAARLNQPISTFDVDGHRTNKLSKSQSA